MVLLCVVLDLRCLPPLLLNDLKQCLLQLANLYSVVNGKGKSESPTLPDSIGLCYIHRNKVFLSNELRIAYSPRGNFSLRDFHHAVNSMPADCFLPEQMTSAMLESSAQISTLIGFLSTEGLYSWGTKGIQRKLILISTFFTESISASREMLMDAADNCITIEFLMIESEAILLDKVPHAGVFSRNIKEIVDDISDLENCSFRRCSWDKWSFCGLAKRLLQELLDYFEEPLQAVFRFKNGLAESINQISCNLFASAINIIDGFNPCQTCRCHGLLIEDVGGHKKKHPCPATNQELAICDVLENAVKIGEQTVLFLPSFQSLAKLQQSSNPIIFDVTELTNLASLSEGVILGIPYIVTPSSPHDIESATDESDNKLELNLQLFAGICQTLYSLDQGLVCTSHCNTETLREATFPCFYLLQPSDKGPMLLRRIAGSEEILPIPDAEITSDSGAPVEMKRSIEASFSRMEIRDYNPLCHERGFHSRVNGLVNESLQFGSIPPIDSQLGSKLSARISLPSKHKIISSESEETNEFSPTQKIKVMEKAESQELFSQTQPYNVNETTAISEEWEQLIVDDNSFSVLSPFQSSKAGNAIELTSKPLDEKTSSILERLEPPRLQKLRKSPIIVDSGSKKSPIILDSGSNKPPIIVNSGLKKSPVIVDSASKMAPIILNSGSKIQALAKKPLVPFQHSQEAVLSLSQPIKPNFQRTKRKLR